jgi:selenide,water dikinase
MADAIAVMLQSSAAAAACLALHGATACTDVTGFGLLGHLLEMLRASSADATLDPDAILALEGARALLAKEITSSLHSDNVAALAALDEAAQIHPLAALLIDPQTAGGLLAGVPAERARHCLDELRQLGYRAALIGRIERSAGPVPRVVFETGAAEVALPEPVTV